MSEFKYTKPIQMPRGTHYGNNYWVFYSRKLGRRVTAFSNLEYENLITLEMDHRVIHYCEQPCEQEVIIDGKKNKTIFDGDVVEEDGREELQEVKYAEELEADTQQGQRSREQINRQKYWCLQNDIDYLVRTDKEIEVGPYTSRNLTYLNSRSRRVSTDVSFNKAFRQILADNGNTLTIGRLYLSGIVSKNNGLSYIADLYYQGIIRFVDIDNAPITNSTEVVLNGE